MDSKWTQKAGIHNAIKGKLDRLERLEYTKVGIRNAIKGKPDDLSTDLVLDENQFSDLEDQLLFI